MGIEAHSRTITVVSDTICPWCFIGKRKLEAALQIVAERGHAIDVAWRPYQLNPDMPDRGMDRREYRAAKFGSTAISDEMDARVRAAGAEFGIDFRFDRIARTPNTLASHVLIADARRAGGTRLQSQVVELLFQAYFVEGRDIGRSEVLQEIAFAAGFAHGPSVSADLWELVEQEAMNARRSGVDAVPTFLLDDHLLFAGAQPIQTIALALLRATEERDAANMAAAT